VVIEELNHEVARQVDPGQLAAADAVLRAALFDDSARQRAARLPRGRTWPGAGWRLWEWRVGGRLRELRAGWRLRELRPGWPRVAICLDGGGRRRL